MIMMETRFRLKAPTLAILETGYEDILVTLPADAVLERSVEPSALSSGWLAVFWEGRQYSVYQEALASEGFCVSRQRDCGGRMPIH
jgi:hypothetical protein